MSRNRQLFRVIFIILPILGALFFAAQSTLFAFDNPHQERMYPLDTDICAQCHRSHTATSSHLVVQAYEADACFTCHDGTGSRYDVAEEVNKSSHHTIAGFHAGSSKQCATCHESHLLDPSTVRLLVDPRNARVSWDILDANHLNYDSPTPPSGMYMWCETCHRDSASTPIGTVLLSAETTGTAYIPNTVEVMSQTSYAMVDNNGDTDTASYWQFFSVDTIGNRYGYNDSSAIGHSSHGRAKLSPAAEANMQSWKGSYGPNYPAMSCTSCHENHGSNQPWLIADSVKGDGIENTATYDMSSEVGQKVFCESCHVGTYSNCNLSKKCTDCHRHGNQF